MPSDETAPAAGATSPGGPSPDESAGPAGPGATRSGGEPVRDAGDDPWTRPAGVDDATVEATGTLSEALEWVERARGHLYEFHQLMGHADATFGEAVDRLRAAGHDDAAGLVATEVVGRNVIYGRWTFQVVEEFDADYHRPVTDVERRVREALVGGRRHVYEAEMKDARRSAGRPHHERRPTDPPAS